MFPAYAIDNDLNYVVDKIRNYYEIGEYKTDDEMGQADAAVAADIEKPDANGRRSRSSRKTPQTDQIDTPPASEPKKRERKSRAEVQEENKQKMAEHMAAVDEAIDKATGGAEEVPFEEAAAIADTVPKPDLQKPPRRTRKERKTEQAANIPDGTDNADFVNVVLTEDTYFHDIENDNYLLKHKGDAVDTVIGGQVVMEQITKEEFVDGCKRIAQEKNPVEGAMNPPETPVRGQRRRRTR